MNTRNEWECLLQIANADLEQYGYSLLIVEPEEGFFNCEIWSDDEDEPIETYAENYYWEELEELITDAWHYVLNNYR